jgi:hypothetical protein
VGTYTYLYKFRTYVLADVYSYAAIYLKANFLCVFMQVP